MLIWKNDHFKIRTIRRPGVGVYRFFMPFYECWYKSLKSLDDKALSISESNYILSKQEEMWFAVHIPEKGYIFQDNKTLEVRFTSQPMMFIDSRIPKQLIERVLRVCKVSDDIIQIGLRNVQELNISHIIEAIK